MPTASPETATIPPPRTRKLKSTCLGLFSALIAWTPTVTVVWPNRPYAAELIAVWADRLAILWLASGIGLLATLRWKWAWHLILAALVICGVSAWSVWPQMPNPEPTSSSKPLVIVHFNYGSAGRHVDQHALTIWLKQQNPDIISLIEPDLQDQLLKTMSEQWGYYRAIGRGPMAVFSRWPISRPPRHIELEDGPADSYAPLFQITFDDGTNLEWLAIHAASPRSADLWQRSMNQTRAGLEVLKARSDHNTSPLIAAGDFNSPPLGRLYRDFKHNSGFHHGAGFSWRAGTWPAWLPKWLSIPIDHIWANGLVTFTSYSIGPDFGSDHRPITAKVLIQSTPQ